MQKSKRAILSFDTSNYTTSVAVLDESQQRRIDKRILLKVKQGERGLRQSDALFQHLENLPQLIEAVFTEIQGCEILAVSVSDRPRPIPGSYMPVFLAGVSFARSLASSLSVPLYTFSHQEGHLAAAALGGPFSFGDEILAFHLSGGTCELLKTRLGEGCITRIGGTKDISFGQLLDRLGVAAGLTFPAGAEMDRLVSLSGPPSAERLLSPVPFTGLSVNLSGMETQVLRLLESGKRTKEELFRAVFDEIAVCLARWTTLAAKETACSNILFSGGVSSSQYLRKAINGRLQSNSLHAVFGEPALSADNAVGIAILGGKKVWQ